MVCGFFVHFLHKTCTRSHFPQHFLTQWLSLYWHLLICAVCGHFVECPNGHKILTAPYFMRGRTVHEFPRLCLGHMLTREFENVNNRTVLQIVNHQMMSEKFWFVIIYSYFKRIISIYLYLYSCVGTVSQWLALSPHSKKILWFPVGAGPLCVESVCSPCVWVGFLQVLRCPPPSKHAH